MCNVLRRSTASDSGEVFVMLIGMEKAGDPKLLLLDNACRMLRLKVVGRVLLLCVCDGDFMVVVDKGFSIKVFPSGRLAQWLEIVISKNVR
jgi:hypothetical protein